MEFLRVCCSSTHQSLTNPLPHLHISRRMFERNFLTLTVLVLFSFTFTMESFSLSRRRVLRSKLIEVGNVDIKSSGIIVERNPRNGSYSYDQWKKAFANQLNEFDYFLNDENISG